ncbi:Uncharacterised protein [Raoultella planticola]|uniref:Uncharacterized protein n=1 Tax=Raoultella planticola TaxID=575 RepID=A0A485BNU3_RAOPL|nr:Uncharacterised protein [Raoultella planticola]
MNGGQRDGYFKAAWRKLAHLRAACQATLARSAEPRPENVPSPQTTVTDIGMSRQIPNTP